MTGSLLVRHRGRRLRRRQLAEFQRDLTRRVARGRPFACVVSGDAELRRLNRKFLGQDHATDVLSFPSGADAGFLGDIAVSLDRAAEQSARLGHDLETEVGILMLHGLLHLLGMDHTRDNGRMARAERRWRRALGLPAGLIERAHP